LKYGSFGEFIAQRLLNYYYNALNTGAGQLATLQWPTWDFEFTLSWLHKMPIFGPLFSYLIQAKLYQFSSFLNRFGDPEFNNPSGLFSIYLDVGAPVGFALLFLIGILSKFFYAYWSNGRAFIGAMYFLFVMTFLELFRYFYLGSSRCFVATLGLLLLLITAKRGEGVRK
jgi:hypothetical protein